MTIIFKESSKKIAEKIQKLILQQFYLQLRKVSDLIKQDIIKENLNIWKQTPTYQSLISGDLTHEFGIPQGTAKGRVDYILNEFGKSISIIPKIKTRKRAGAYVMLDINVFSKNINPAIFDSPEANVKTGKKASNDLSGDFGSFGAIEISKELPWLRWLLYEGNKYIVYGYEYQPIVAANSRSGKGLMIKSDSSWKVPAQFSGTKNSHWIIRALNDNRNFLISEYGRIIEKHLK
jgi:hypothetical protein